MRVLHVTQPVEAGVARVVTELVADQVHRGIDVHVALPPSPLAGRLARAGATTWPWRATRQPGPWSLAQATRLARVVAAAQPDVVHLHSAAAGLAGRLALRGRLPTVYQPHAWSFHAVTGPARRAAVAWERLAAGRTDVVVCVSRREREVGIAHGVDARWALIPNGVDVEAVRPGDRDEARAHLALDGSPTVVCVGRLCHQKGQDLLLDAWPTVRTRVPGAVALLVGDGPERATLAARAVDGVHLVGAVDDVRAHLAAADVIVLPSRWEGMSIALLEAMAAGRAIVATDVPGNAEALAGTGVVVPADSPGALATALTDLLADATSSDALGQAARAHAIATHRIERTCDAMADLAVELADAERLLEVGT